LCFPEAPSPVHNEQTRRWEGGNWLPEENKSIASISTIPEGKGGCEKACKTRKRKNLPAANNTDNASQFLQSAETYEFFWRLCQEDNSCLVGAGEEILKDCQCLNEFGEATAILEALKAAGQDIICSDGVKQ